MSDLRGEIRARLEMHPTAMPVADPAMAKRVNACVASAVEAFMAILELHQPEDVEYVDADGQGRMSTDCATCDTGGMPNGWPCETIQVIAQAVGMELTS